MTDAEVIITNLKKRYTGVSGTINALLPELAKSLKIGFVGTDLLGAQRAKSGYPENFSYLTLWQAIRISSNTLPDGRKRIWHVRRDPEMLLTIVLRDVLRFPIRIVFTSAAQRRHSWFPRWLISRMDSVISTTIEAAKFVKSSTVIPHGIDTKFFMPPTDKLNAWKSTKLPGKYGIGISGRIRPEKGTDTFIDAMLDVLPQFPEFTAVIIGLCQPQFRSFKNDLEQRIAKKNLLNRILFIGEIQPNHIQTWYSSLLITVASPRYEGYGLTVLEGMACGCAIAATDAGIFKQLIDESNAGHIVPTGDSNSLAGALRIMMENPAATAQMGAQGRKFIEKKYSATHEAESILDIYETIWRA